MRSRLTYLLLTISTLSLANLAAAEIASNWPRWRGPHDNGGNEQGAYPTKWDEHSNLLWKAPLPGKGCSTPVVWDKQIFLTAPADGQDAVLAFDGSGKRLWQTSLGPENPGKHQNGSGCNPSPATDGEAVFVCFKSGNLAAVEFDGKVRWQINLVERFGKDTLFWDYGTSPVWTEKHVVVARMHHGDSWLAAFDKGTGQMRWKVARNYETPVEGDQSYTSPILIRHQGKEALLVMGGEHLTAHDALDGKVLWSCGDFNPKARSYLPVVASPLVAGEFAVVPYGRDRDATVHGIRLGGAGDVTATHRAWKRENAGAFVPSPAAYKGRVYFVGDRGEVECLDPGTGNSLWKGELPKHRASYYSSPALADGKLYAAREDGVVFVASVEGKFEILSENNLGERVIASPVPVANRLLIRGEKHLFCIAAN